MKMSSESSHKLAEVVRLFLKLGVTAFGGPAAHIGMMHDETVKRRKWLSDQEFLDLVGATNLIPGPNSTEMAIHIGFLRAGWPGLIAGGACFIVPADADRAAAGLGLRAIRRPAAGRVAAVRHQARRDRHHRAGALEPGPQRRSKGR